MVLYQIKQEESVENVSHIFNSACLNMTVLWQNICSLHTCTICTKVVTSSINPFKQIAMSTKFLLGLLLLAGFASCTTAYKSTQTPDDVYFSPVRAIKENNNDRKDQVNQQPASEEDREIRNRIRDRRYRILDEDYSYDYNYNTYCNCYCNHYGYGYYNSPYYNPHFYYNPSYTPVQVNTTPRKVNLNSYTVQNAPVLVNSKTGKITNSTASSRYNNSNGSGVGNLLRRVITPSANNSNSNSSSNNSTRTYQPSSSSSRSSSSGSSSGGNVSRPSRPGGR